MSTGSASPLEAHVESDMEIQKAVSTILPTDHDYSNLNLNNRGNKRVQENNDTDGSEQIQSTNDFNPPLLKKPHIQRLYKPENSGPFEVIIQDKKKNKINPFTVGKILKKHHMDIDHITRAGKNISVICKNYIAANNLVNSPHLLEFNVFVPSIRVHTLGVVYAEPEVSELEILSEASSIYPIIQAERIRRRVNGNDQLTNTHFVKITFESEKLPDFVYLNYVRMKVDPYMIRVKQCYRCFAYGHVANSPCNKPRICRDCAGPFHTDPCQAPRKCVHCGDSHSSNSKYCPEYMRQKNIKDRMSLMKEGYHVAAQYFPITYKKQGKSSRLLGLSYSQVAQLDFTDDGIYPTLPSSQASTPISQLNVSNRYTPLLAVSEPSSSRQQSFSPHFKVSGTSYRRPIRNSSLYKPKEISRPIVDKTNPPTKPVQDDRLSVQDKSHLTSLLFGTNQ
uniref:Pre-C2HC domain-containing protein n=1 Tax=Homalodisca liturata TaxID=320908 RepID=A0A1B6IW02_9HEMI